jgi:hypothetical protein
MRNKVIFVILQIAATNAKELKLAIFFTSHYFKRSRGMRRTLNVSENAGNFRNAWGEAVKTAADIL